MMTTHERTWKLVDLIDISKLQELMDIFYDVTTIPTAILDADGTVLTMTGWQDICTKFHRVSPRCSLRCRQSDTTIAQQLGEGQQYVAYECANGLVDVAHPILVEGVHVGTVFTGQFLYEPPDIERFRQQAKEFDFDEAAYLEALSRVPIVSREKIAPGLNYLSQFTAMLAAMGSERIRQMETQQSLRESEQNLRVFQSVADNAPDAIAVTDLNHAIIYANRAFRTMTGYGDEVMEMDIHQFYVDDPTHLENVTREVLEQGYWRGALTYKRKDETLVQGYLSVFPIFDAHGHMVSLARIVHDMTEQMQRDRELLELKEQVINAQRAALRELSTPLIPLSNTVVLMPLVGTIDSSRAQQVMETLLEGIATHQATTAILDITGVSVVDTQVANALIQAAQAVKLLGAQVILTGIGPAMAQTLIHLGADMSSVVTRGSLQGAVEDALGVRHRAQVHPNGAETRRHRAPVV
ncbi:MAG: PAS domain-containing protein [Chloroflexaceae bacterium]|nr:PAS domain-containing protein [Chloroflexaceae bacterium]